MWKKVSFPIILFLHFRSQRFLFDFLFWNF
jgi:hypothetical protein